MEKSRKKVDVYDPFVRAGYMTPSDFAPILGLSPWANASDVYNSKVYPQAVEVKESWLCGLALEDELVSWTAGKAELGTVERGRQFFGDIFCTELDGFADGAVLEAKVVGVNGAADWGASGTGEVPDHVKIQCLAKHGITRASRTYIGAWFVGAPGMPRKFYVVDGDREREGQLLELAKRFWELHVIPKNPPMGWSIPIEVLQAINRTDAAVELDDRWAEEWLALVDYESILSGKKMALRKKILGLMGEAGKGITSLGNFISRRQKGSYSWDKDAMKADGVDWTKYAKQSEHLHFEFRGTK